MAYTTLFFDLDGTLCQPRLPFATVFTASCAPLLDGSAVDVQTLQRAWTEALEVAGPATTAGCLARALAACDIAVPEPLIEQCAATLNIAWAAAQRPDPEAVETLTRLARRYPLGLITNGPSDAQRAVLESLGLDGAFRWIIVSGDADVGIRKPDARIFRHALTVAGSRPEQAWYIGDSPANDIAGAAGAGLRTCWIHPRESGFPVDLPAPDASITQLDELLRMLG